MRSIPVFLPAIVLMLSGGNGSGGPPGTEAKIEERLREIDNQVAKERRYEEIGKQWEKEQRAIKERSSSPKNEIDLEAELRKTPLGQAPDK
jgi:hypothetical protein